jgi:hypothetical protein
MLAICAAFAAPLLSFTGRQSFGINLFGRAKAGKTTALLAGASVIGLGREADLPNCGATAAAKGESARMFNDMLLPLNEVGLLGGSKKKAYPEIRDYAIFAEKTRDEGEYARCIDVPVNRPNRHSIVNRFPANLPKEKRRRWAEDRVIELRKACEANHGTAFSALHR